LEEVAYCMSNGTHDPRKH